jgi:hypothetical protein
LLILAVVGVLVVGGVGVGAFVFLGTRGSSYEPPPKRSFGDEISTLKVEFTDGTQRSLLGKVTAPGGTYFTSADAQYPLLDTQQGYSSPEYMLTFDVSKAKCGKKQKVKVRAENYSYKPIKLSASFTREPSMNASQGVYGGTHYDISCECIECKGTFDPKEGLKMKVPKGAQVTLGGAKVPVSGGEGKLKPDAAALAMDQPYGKPIELPLVMTTSDKKKLTTTVSLPSDNDDLTRRLRAAPGKGLAFAKEDGGGLLIAFEGEDFRGSMYGTGTRTKDIDKVTIGSTKYSSKRCGVYQYPGGSFILSVETESSSWDVYDRRTGKKLTSKTFKGQTPRCPLSVSTTSGSDQVWETGYVDAQAENDWLTQQAHK